MKNFWGIFSCSLTIFVSWAYFYFCFISSFELRCVCGWFSVDSGTQQLLCLILSTGLVVLMLWLWLLLDCDIWVSCCCTCIVSHSCFSIPSHASVVSALVLCAKFDMMSLFKHNLIWKVVWGKVLILLESQYLPGANNY